MTTSVTDQDLSQCLTQQLSHIKMSRPSIRPMYAIIHLVIGNVTTVPIISLKDYKSNELIAGRYVTLRDTINPAIPASFSARLLKFGASRLELEQYLSDQRALILKNRPLKPNTVVPRRVSKANSKFEGFVLDTSNAAKNKLAKEKRDITKLRVSINKENNSNVLNLKPFSSQKSCESTASKNESGREIETYLQKETQNSTSTSTSSSEIETSTLITEAILCETQVDDSYLQSEFRPRNYSTQIEGVQYSQEVEYEEAQQESSYEELKDPEKQLREETEKTFICGPLCQLFPSKHQMEFLRKVVSAYDFPAPNQTGASVYIGHQGYQSPATSFQTTANESLNSTPGFRDPTQTMGATQVELVEGMGVYIPKVRRSIVLLMSDGDPRKIVQNLLLEFFSAHKLQHMNAFGRSEGKEGVPTKLREAIYAFTRQHMRKTTPEGAVMTFTQVEFTSTINTMCKNKRQKLNKNL